VPFAEFLQWGWIDDNCVAGITQDRRRIVVADLRSGVQRTITSDNSMSDVCGLRTDPEHNRMYSTHSHYCLVWSLNNLRVVSQTPLDDRRIIVDDRNTAARGISRLWVVKSNGEYWPRVWTTATHRYFPKRFRDAVHALMMIAFVQQPNLLPWDCWSCVIGFMAVTLE
jgi:hypothetical protein